MLAFLALTLPGLIVGYVLFLRPVLAARFKDEFATASGFWDSVWALCGRSVTLALGYLLQLLGWLLQIVEPLATFLGDPDFKQQVTDTLQANPKVLGYVLMIISCLTIAARVRSVFKGDE